MNAISLKYIQNTTGKNTLSLSLGGRALRAAVA